MIDTSGLCRQRGFCKFLQHSSTQCSAQLSTSILGALQPHPRYSPFPLSGKKQRLQSDWATSLCAYRCNIVVLPIPNRLTSCSSAGGLYAHTAAKLIFIRLFRHSRHVYSHTWLGWTTWVCLCFAAVVIAFVFATAVPIFSYLIGIAAAVFASWYTYGFAGFFWIHDTYYLGGGREALRKRWFTLCLAVSTVLAGTFVGVAGTFVSIKVRKAHTRADRSWLLMHGSL